MIDDGLQQPWPQQVRDAMGRFRQGDVIALPTFYYLATPTYPLWELSLPEEGEDREPQVVERDWSTDSLGLITSQTCDITEDGVRRLKKPWIQVAPVYPRRFGGTPPQYIVRLDGTGLPLESVADLRIELPVEKGWLVGLDPIAGFSDAEGFRLLALRLANLRDREAFPQWIEDGILTRLDDEEGLEAAGLLEGVEEIRLAFEGDDLSTTRVAGLVIVPSGDEYLEALENVWSAWCEELAAQLAPETQLLPVVVRTADAMSARMYRRTAPLKAFSPAEN